MKHYYFNDLSKKTYSALLKRPVIDYATLFSEIQPIIDAVRNEGNEAIRRYTLQFDRVPLKSVLVNVRPEDQIGLDEAVKSAFRVAYNNIRTFHEAQIPASLTVETMPGVVCRRLPRAIGRVGLYIPGGSAVLPSSVLMLGIPAQLAGCREVTLATPPNAEGNVSAEVEFAAALCGIKNILLAGGAQAIAAMAYGTESVPKADKILGPGNQYVTAAKMLLQNSDAMISIDMPAGPSEVLVAADGTAIPEYVAADLLSQAEHGPDSQVILLSLPEFNLDSLKSSLENQIETLPRAEIARKALDNSYIIECDNPEDALKFLNDYAPEHLILSVAEADSLVHKVINAGSVFLGNWTPESAGDYASGTNHTLPTYGYARMYSGVSIDTYFRQMTVQQLSAEGLLNLGPHVEIMARAESLEAHARAVSLRLRDLQKEFIPSNLE